MRRGDRLRFAAEHAFLRAGRQSEEVTNHEEEVFLRQRAWG
jgi:hypothetical protein